MINLNSSLDDQASRELCTGGCSIPDYDVVGESSGCAVFDILDFLVALADVGAGSCVTVVTK